MNPYVLGRSLHESLMQCTGCLQKVWLLLGSGLKSITGTVLKVFGNSLEKHANQSGSGNHVCVTFTKNGWKAAGTGMKCMEMGFRGSTGTQDIHRWKWLLSKHPVCKWSTKQACSIEVFNLKSNPMTSTRSAGLASITMYTIYYLSHNGGDWHLQIDLLT